MKFIRKSALLVIAAIVAAVLGFVSPASADGNEGGNADWGKSLSKRDFGLYCLGQGYQRGVTSVYPHDGYHLRCQDADGSLYNIDVTDVCNYTYGNGVRKEYGEEIRLIDRLADVGNTYGGWGCMLDLGVAGDVSEADLQRWCEKWDLDVINDGRTYAAYGSFCTDHHGYFKGIPMDRLCAEFFGTNTLDRVRNLYDKHSWECRYSKE